MFEQFITPETKKYLYKSYPDGVLYNADCLTIMKWFPEKSVDIILCDLPYGITAIEWDIIIPLEFLWKQYKQIIKDNTAIVLTASQPFTSMLVMSNLKMFKYEWIWEKTNATNYWFVKKQPAKKHENICIFYKKQPTYNPIMDIGKPYIDKRGGTKHFENNRQIITERNKIENKGTRYPSTIQKISNGNNKIMHPTQKPIALFEYLIKTYTNENDIVLDNCIGSSTTAVACVELNRKFIGIEISEEYCKICDNRIMDAYEKKKQGELELI